SGRTASGGLGSPSARYRVTAGRAATTAVRDRIAADLVDLGLTQGEAVLVHSSLRSIDHGGRGAGVVVEALKDVIGPEGTLVVPTQTADNSTTSPHFRAATRALSDEQVARYRAAMPGFDPATTASSGMGALAEYVRTLPDAVRSTHPQTSFAAVGAHAEALTTVHALECHLGEDSPQGSMYRLDASVLLLGVGYDKCTAFHLAEYRYRRSAPKRRYECVVRSQGRNEWITFQDLDLDDSDFTALGARFEAEFGVVSQRVLGAVTRLFPLRAAVDFAVPWFTEHRG
ncbi:MAG: aminoglycoside N(3)-acetyltransferase, partial [Sciscionella sp.]